MSKKIDRYRTLVYMIYNIRADLHVYTNGGYLFDGRSSVGYNFV